MYWLFLQHVYYEMTTAAHVSVTWLTRCGLDVTNTIANCCLFCLHIQQTHSNISINLK